MKFYVRGRGPFPYDMLRYDCAYPMRPDDVAGIEPTHLWSDRTVCLYSVRGSITPDRWRSFGWSANETNVWED